MVIFHSYVSLPEGMLHEHFQVYELFCWSYPVLNLEITNQYKHGFHVLTSWNSCKTLRAKNLSFADGSKLAMPRLTW